MATQGLVTVTVNGEVTGKVIVGCDGYNADDLVGKIEGLGSTPTIDDLLSFARGVGFGCKDCLVVMDRNSAFIYSGEELDERYRRTFNDAKFNPRWELGTADYIRVVEL